MYNLNQFPIRQWAEEDRPREKLLMKGRHSLSAVELLAILIGSGSAGESALDLARKVMQLCGQNLDALGKLDTGELTSVKGIGPAKATMILAALELGRRRSSPDADQRKPINDSSAIVEILAPVFKDLRHEEFWVIFLNRGNRVIAKECISVGGVTGTVADIRIILRKAVVSLSTSIVLAHNHPSGSIHPSDADLRLTRNILEAAKLFEIRLVDHLIFADGKYYSFADEGKL